MKTTHLFCACLALVAGGNRLWAQNANYAQYYDMSDEVCDNPYCTTDDGQAVAPSAVDQSADDGDDEGTVAPPNQVACQPAAPGSQSAGRMRQAGGKKHHLCNQPGVPSKAGLKYYEKRQKRIAKCVAITYVAQNPLLCLHNVVENDIDLKVNHCKCLGLLYGNRVAYLRSYNTPWHGEYYYPDWGAPVSLIVPPTCEYQTNYSWGVPASRVEPIDHQFSRRFLGTDYGFGSSSAAGGYGAAGGQCASGACGPPCGGPSSGGPSGGGFAGVAPSIGYSPGGGYGVGGGYGPTSAVGAVGGYNPTSAYAPFGTVGFKVPPFQPNDTNQFGVYYVRGPW